ncbi:MAG: hypothetical protein JWL98_194, partial [Xanthomonadaceae bacterium]|nr:hypothetical protein [Xanthomonadaceae bacterium]
GLGYGWDEARFNAASRISLPDGTPYQNLCIGCDSIHQQVLGPVLAEARARRRALRGEPIDEQPAAAPRPVIPITVYNTELR